MNGYALTALGIAAAVSGRPCIAEPVMPADKRRERDAALTAYHQNVHRGQNLRLTEPFPELTYEGEEVYDGGLWLASLSRGGKGWDVDGEESTAEAALDAMLNALSSQLEQEGRYEPTVEREAR